MSEKKIKLQIVRTFKVMEVLIVDSGTLLDKKGTELSQMRTTEELMALFWYLICSKNNHLPI